MRAVLKMPSGRGGRGAISGTILVLIVLVVATLNGWSVDSQRNPGHWPQWRGPALNGVTSQPIPVEFGETKNVKWKVAIPGRGYSTPVIWGDRIFLTTAVPTGKKQEVAESPAGSPGGRAGRPGGAGGGAASGEEHRFLVLALDRRTGKTLWERVAKVATPHEGYHRQYGSFASNSPATDGKLVYAPFGSRGVYAYDLDGTLVWERDFGVQMRMRLAFGEGSAPLLYENMLILNYDNEGDSFIVALDKRTGKDVWRVARDEASSWSMPFALTHQGQKQIVLSATNRTRAYDPANGQLLWECGGLGGNVIPTPALQNDILLVMSGYRDPKLMAIRLGGKGDLTGTSSVVWSTTRGTAYTPSPILLDNKYYTLSDNGLLSCFNATTGEPHYLQRRLGEPDTFKASPIAANGKLYLASESGVVSVVRMGAEMEILATNRFEDQMFVSSPIVAEGELFLRSSTHLFCVSEQK
jgi:outer membrane protein assembly factor BamB